MTEGLASPTSLEATRARAALAWRLAPVAVGLGTLAVSAVTLASRPLTTDEAAALAQTGRPWPDVVRAAVHDDPGQGAYLLLLKLVSHYDTAEVTLRAVSAVAIALAATLMAVLGSRLLGRTGGVVAGLALGANAGVIDVAREARPYALGVLAVVASTLALVVTLQRGGTWRWTVYGGLAALLPLAHPLASSALLAHAAALALTHDRAVLRRGGITFGVGASAAAVLVAWMAADRFGAADGLGPVELTDLAGGLLRGLGWSPVLAIAAVAGVAALFGGRTSAAPGSWGAALVTALVCAPVAVSLLAAVALPVAVSTALVLCAPGLALAAGAAVSLLPSRASLWASLAALALVAGVTLTVRALAPPAQDWRALAAALQRVRGSRETVVVVPERSRAAFAYYAPYVSVIRHARGDGVWVAVAADTPLSAIAAARPSVGPPTYALLRQFRYGDGLRLQHWVRP